MGKVYRNRRRNIFDSCESEAEVSMKDLKKILEITHSL